MGLKSKAIAFSGSIHMITVTPYQSDSLLVSATRDYIDLYDVNNFISLRDPLGIS
jgi:hypothetical protein